MHFNLLLLLGLGCSPSPEYKTCALNNLHQSFEPEDLLCVQIDMHWRAFKHLSEQNRFGGDGSEQLQGAMGHIPTSCTEPFPDPFTYYPATVQVGTLSVSDVGIRKKGFVGSVLQKSKDRPSLKIKGDKYVEGQVIDNLKR